LKITAAADKTDSDMPLGNERIYKGESEMEYYGLLSPDDVPEDPEDDIGDWPFWHKQGLEILGEEE
jgi:hypothetical protein